MNGNTHVSLTSLCNQTHTNQLMPAKKTVTAQIKFKKECKNVVEKRNFLLTFEVLLKQT